MSTLITAEDDEILSRLDLSAECIALGISREDLVASKVPLWELAAAAKVFPEWRTARQHFADKAKVKASLIPRTYAELLALPDAAPIYVPSEPAKNSLPKVLLPGGATTITECAAKLGELLAATGRFYHRGGAVVRAMRGGEELEPLKVSAARSDFEIVAALCHSAGDGELAPAICKKDEAEAIIAAESFASSLPPIIVLSQCPLLVEGDSGLKVVAGYDRESGILARGHTPKPMSLEEAKRLIVSLLVDFDFPTAGDHSRAAAGLISPALVLGGLLGEYRAPADYSEADKSQSGKGYRAKLITAIYRHKAHTVTQRDRGVGSTREDFDSALIAGASFIAIDNLRGNLSEPWLESFLTESRYSARKPYSPSISVCPSRVVLLLSSNRAEMTQDLANRCSIVRIRKRPDGYRFQQFAEGDLLAHVVANQPLYLGAVFAIVREWHRLGKPVLETHPHDFRQWSGAMSFIVERILGLAPLLEDHRAIQNRTANPQLTWLRELAFAVIAEGGEGAWLRPYQLLQVAIDRGIETSGVPQGLDSDDQTAWGNALRAIGRKLGSVMREDRIEIDAVAVERRSGIDASGRATKEYTFSPISRNAPNAPAIAPAMETSVSAMPQSVVVIDKRACAPAHAPARGATLATHCGIAGALREGCNHLDRSTWIRRGDSMMCRVCEKFIGRAKE